MVFQTYYFDEHKLKPLAMIALCVGGGSWLFYDVEDSYITLFMKRFTALLKTGYFLFCVEILD